jgi:hypothetical protein
MGASLKEFRRIEELERMHDVCTYHIQVQDQVDESAFNATSPLQVTVIQKDSDITLFTICTDQPGLVGLIRHLHRHGFVLLTVTRER